MKNSAVILGLIILLLMGCTTPAPNKAEEVNLAIPQETTWQQAQEMILAGKVKTIAQFHDLKVILDLKDGSQFITMEPAIDDVLRVVEQCGAKCEDIGLMME